MIHGSSIDWSGGRMKEPTKEQIKEFWERCGLAYKDEVGYHGWYKPVGLEGLEWVANELPIDLNNLFKCAVPKLKEEYRNWKSVLHDWVDNLTGDPKKDAISLFWVLREHLGNLGGN